MAKIEGLVEGQDPATPVGELLIAVPDGVACATCRQFAVPDKYYGCNRTWSPVLPPMTKAHLDNIEAARTAWEASDRAVPFPDYWVGWQAASVLIGLREAALAGQLNAALQPTIDGEAFKKLRLENARFRIALENLADGNDNPATYAQLVLDGVL